MLIRSFLPFALGAILFAKPAHAETPLEQGFSGALRGCEEWVLNPESWADGVAPFVARVGLGDRMGLVGQVDEAALPPPALRVGNRYWRINSTPKAGFILVVSDRVPMCHVTGGGDLDLQPAVQAVLGAGAFVSDWEKVGEETKGELVSTVFRNRKDPAFSIVVSRPKTAGQRLDRVQVVATATYALSK